MLYLDYANIPKFSFKDPKYKEIQQTRRFKLLLFAQKLTAHNVFNSISHKQKEKHIWNLESGCYNSTIDQAEKFGICRTLNTSNFIKMYHTICTKLLQIIDIKYKNSNVLVGRIVGGKICPFKMGSMPLSQILPEKYEELNITIKKKYSDDKRKLEKNLLYRCPKCKQNYIQIENRYNCSADETVNLTLTCTKCGCQWNA